MATPAPAPNLAARPRAETESQVRRAINSEAPAEQHSAVSLDVDAVEVQADRSHVNEADTRGSEPIASPAKNARCQAQVVQRWWRRWFHKSVCCSAWSYSASSASPATMIYKQREVVTGARRKSRFVCQDRAPARGDRDLRRQAAIAARRRHSRRSLGQHAMWSSCAPKAGVCPKTLRLIIRQKGLPAIRVARLHTALHSVGSGHGVFSRRSSRRHRVLRFEDRRADVKRRWTEHSAALQPVSQPASVRSAARYPQELRQLRQSETYRAIKRDFA